MLSLQTLMWWYCVSWSVSAQDAELWITGSVCSQDSQGVMCCCSQLWRELKERNEAGWVCSHEEGCLSLSLLLSPEDHQQPLRPLSVFVVLFFPSLPNYHMRHGPGNMWAFSATKDLYQTQFSLVDNNTPKTATRSSKKTSTCWPRPSRRKWSLSLWPVPTRLSASSLLNYEAPAGQSLAWSSRCQQPRVFMFMREKSR